LIIGTTSNVHILEEMQLLHPFNAVLNVPKIQPGEPMKAVIRSLGGFTEDEINQIGSNVQHDIPLKTLIMLIEMAKQDDSIESSAPAPDKSVANPAFMLPASTAVERFLEFANNFGVWGSVRRN